MTKYWCVVFVVAALTGCDHSNGKKTPVKPVVVEPKNPFASTEALGKTLFFDKNLSKNRTQSCASCHQPEFAFIDANKDAQGKVSAFSLGDDGISLGDRNTPSITYASFSPAFAWGKHARYNSQQVDYEGYQGGFFWDGRAATLAAQAAGPFLNPIEMAMPNAAAVIERVKANPDYVIAMNTFYGNDIFANADKAYEALTQAIASFEKTAEFNPFDSKYDRSLKGDYFYDPLSKEGQGKALFFSQQFTNCATCHQLKPNNYKQETFTNYEYHNVGIPKNTFDRQMFGKDTRFTDSGLIDNPMTNKGDSLRGKYKVPSLRNVAVTSPYMHNGVFKELRTIILFYQNFLEGSQHTLNPETGQKWDEAEVLNTISEKELKDGRLLKDEEIDALVCFLRTLTDAKYEALLPKDDLACDAI
jgi:cytochrome c peroxidase